MYEHFVMTPKPSGRVGTTHTHSRGMVAALLGLVVGFVLGVDATESHMGLIGQCPALELPTAGKRLYEQINANGTVSEGYDTNGDNRIDVEAVSHQLQATIHPGSKEIEIQHSPFPFLYIVDTDKDGQPDASFVDTLGTGDCRGLRPYKEDFHESKPDTDSAPDARL